MLENKKKNTNICRAVIFVIVLLGILCSISYILRPNWFEVNHYDTLNGFYEQPDDSIEVLFLGASQVAYGITPMELYEDYGISSYNLGTSNQAVLMSYYLMLEAYEYQSESLEVIVFDTSMFQRIPGIENYEKVILDMKYSENKLNAIKDIADTYDDFISYVSPLVSYHTRWMELSEDDFSVIDYDVNTSVRGYCYSITARIDSVSYDECNMPNIYVSSTDEAVFVDEALIYFDFMVEFCEENDIQLVLTKIPTTVTKWTDEDHNATQTLADSYELEFYDFNYAPLLDEIELNCATTFSDFTHLNYYGATVMTEWFGEYLVDLDNITDVRGLEEYEFLEEELEEYNRYIFKATLDEISDPYEYISTVNQNEDYSVLITVQKDATNKLTEEQLDNFEELGLTKLATLEYQGAYIAVLEDGEVIYEESKNLVEGEITEEDLYLKYEGTLMDGTSYTLESGGGTEVNMSSCIIDGSEYSKASQGINIVIYDNISGEVIDNVVFDTYSSATRRELSVGTALETKLENGEELSDLSGVVRKLYLYNMMYDEAYTIASMENESEEIELLDYLNLFWNDENYAICISTQGEVEEGAQEIFVSLGLVTLSELEQGDIYTAIIDGDNILLEEKSSEVQELELDLLDIEVLSVGESSDQIASIVIDSTEYTSSLDGLTVVIYNKNTELLVDMRTFNTSTYTSMVD